jgi:putative PIN family toxin of toxin-antitoxin system
VRLVVDANVLIAAFVARGVCAELLEYCVREHDVITSTTILDEVRDNLVKKVKVTVAHADQAVRLLRTRLQVVEPVGLESPVCRDPDDDVVLGTALAGSCDAIVTGDKDLLDLRAHERIAIVSPRGFWRFESQRSRR